MALSLVNWMENLAAPAPQIPTMPINQPPQHYQGYQQQAQPNPYMPYGYFNLLHLYIIFMHSVAPYPYGGQNPYGQQQQPSTGGQNPYGQQQQPTGGYPPYPVQYPVSLLINKKKVLILILGDISRIIPTATIWRLSSSSSL
jgi:hypothetical protein